MTWLNSNGMRSNVGLRVLVIDDDVDLTEMVQAILELRSYEVCRAHSGEEGIEATRHWHPHAILLDLSMPGMDGRQVCKAIRQFSEIPILVLSALSKPETVARVLDEGADDYLIKPVSSDTLIAHLNSLIRRTQGRRIADRVANVG